MSLFYISILKKSIEKEDVGNEWLDDIKRNLLFNESYISAIYSEFSNDSNLGVISPVPFWKIKPQMVWGNNLDAAKTLYEKIDLNASTINNELLSFPAGSMFWFRPKAVKQLFAARLKFDDFPKEPIPDDGTIAHAIERVFEKICIQNGYSSKNISPQRYEMSWPSYVKPKVSIIIPVFNSEATISQSIESILQQDCTHIPFEILCIDNGSTDKSLSILKSYENLYSNVVVDIESTKGAGSARNLGVNISTGKYIIFLDSDDVLATDAISNLYTGITTATDIDMAASSLVMFDEEEFDHPIPYSLHQKIIVVDNFYEATEREHWKTILSDFGPCAKIYKRKFLVENDINFPENINYEDNLFIYDCYLAAHKVCLLPKITYYYRKFKKYSGTTQSTDYSIPHLHDQLDVIDLMLNKFVKDKKHKYNIEIINALILKITWLIPYYDENSFVNELNQYPLIIGELADNELYENLCVSSGFKGVK